MKEQALTVFVLLAISVGLVSPVTAATVDVSAASQPADATTAGERLPTGSGSASYDSALRRSNASETSGPTADRGATELRSGTDAAAGAQAASVDFGNNVYADQRGDVVSITLEMSGTETATLQIGDVDTNGYSVVTEVSDDDRDGVATVEFNSYTAGSSAVETVTPGDSGTSLSDTTNPDGSFTSEVGGDVLAATDYDLFLAEGPKDGAEVGSDGADARATLSLSEPSVDDLQVWTAPESELGDLRSAETDDIARYATEGELTQTSTVAASDVLFLQISASGLEGAVDYGDTTALYSENSRAGSVFSLTLKGVSTPNVDDNTVNIADLGTDDYSVLYAGESDTHFVVIDSTALLEEGTFDHSDGDEYTANFTAYGGNSNLFDEDVSVTQDVAVEEPEIELDTNADGDIVLEAAASQRVTGETNLAPGSVVEVAMNSDTDGDPFIKRPEATVQTDQSFTAVADFSSNNPGSEFTTRALVDDVDSGEVDGRLVDTAPTRVTETPIYTEPDTATPDPPDTPVYTATPDPPDTPVYTATAFRTQEPVYTTADVPAGGSSPYSTGTDGTAVTTTTEPSEEDDAANELNNAPVSGSGPGFGVGVTVVALLALLAIARPRL